MKHPFYLGHSSSTNDEILNFLDDGSEDFPALYTFNQTKGRGQYGKSWESSENLNLAFSIALKDKFIRIPLSLFNYYTASVVRNFIANLTCSEVFIKWPNDIIIKNKKIAGMLIERKKINAESYVIIGIGINVLQNNFKDLPSAGSLLTQTAKKFELHLLAEQLYYHLSKELLQNNNEKDILQKFNNHLFRRNEISVFEENSLRQNGIIKHADADGFLWVQMENDGLRKFYHKEVQLLY